MNADRRSMAMGVAVVIALVWPSARAPRAESLVESSAPRAAAATPCDAQADLTGSLSLNGERGTVTNRSATCTYDVGIAAYRMFDLRLRTQGIFDWATSSIAPGATITLHVERPGCGTQVDLFAGTVAMSFVNDDYRGRFLAGRWVNLRFGFCEPKPCTSTQGYWQNHIDSWPIQTMMLGSNKYSRSQLLAILHAPAEGNGIVSLAHQLIAAKLNLASGVHDISIHALITDADTTIGAAEIPPIGNGFLLPAEGEDVLEQLDAFNNGLTGPGQCSF